MTRARVLAAALMLAGCSGGQSYPTSAQIDAFEAPRSQSFVFVYEPWSYDEGMVVVARGGGVDSLRHLGDVKVTCLNVPCETRDGLAVPKGKPPAGVDRIELRVEKAGYEPAMVWVPIKEGAPEYPRFVVLLRAEAPR